MELAMCKDMERWYEKVQQAVERVDYIGVVQQGRDKEEHDIWLLNESSLDRINKSVEYWEKMSRGTTLRNSREMGQVRETMDKD
jgi:hypothetical protein